MLLHQFDYESGAYSGSRVIETADCDPRAPDTVLVPGNATAIAPPRCGVGLWPFWRDGKWTVMEIIDVPDPYEQFHCE